ncbi:hypothetical protein EON80_30075 [bacterium]|nr:MAG: hypothetical protein EON80_30075 [bacterium]
MFLDTIHGIIDRRILLNYRLDAQALERVLPTPFRPKLYRGYAIGGVCMIRFKGLRPRLVPEWLGMGSENAAHRFAVEWEQDGEHREGVFIPRRDTNSWFNKQLGGRVFPGIFQRSRFEAQETDETLSLRVTHENGTQALFFSGHVADILPPTSLFPSVKEAAEFFSLGATGYSQTYVKDHYHGMDLLSKNWSVTPLAIEKGHSCFFDDANNFPMGTAELDCALLMRGIQHEWHSQPDIYLSAQTGHLTTNPKPA